MLALEINSKADPASESDEPPAPITIPADPNDIEFQEERNAKTGAIYLRFRFGEYTFKILGTAFVIFNNQPCTGLVVTSKVLTGIGIISGVIGNYFQDKQGARDLKITKQYRGYYKTHPTKWDKRGFAYLARVRGNVNQISDITGFVTNITQDNYSHSLSTSTGILTDVFGLIKNVRDVYRNQGWKRLAFGFCTVSRFPLILGSLLMNLYKWKVLEEDGWYHGAMMISNAGMLAFNLGAAIRDWQYCRTKDINPILFSTQAKAVAHSSSSGGSDTEIEAVEMEDFAAKSDGDMEAVKSSSLPRISQV